jgi:hypothetical protein
VSSFLGRVLSSLIGAVALTLAEWTKRTGPTCILKPSFLLPYNLTLLFSYPNQVANDPCMPHQLDIVHQSDLRLQAELSVAFQADFLSSFSEPPTENCASCRRRLAREYFCKITVCTGNNETVHVDSYLGTSGAHRRTSEEVGAEKELLANLHELEIMKVSSHTVSVLEFTVDRAEDIWWEDTTNYCEQLRRRVLLRAPYALDKHVAPL